MDLNAPAGESGEGGRAKGARPAVGDLERQSPASGLPEPKTASAPLLQTRSVPRITAVSKRSVPPTM